MKKLIVTLLKTGVTVGLIGYIVFLIDFNALQEIRPRIQWGWLALAPVVYAIGFWGVAYRWQSMFHDLGSEFSLKDSYIAYLIGAFYNVILPGGIGGDIIRIGYAKRKTSRSTTLIASTVFAERIFGSMTAFQMGAIAIFFLPMLLVVQLGWEILGLILGGAIWLTGWILIFFFFWGKLGNFLESKMKDRPVTKKLFYVVGKLQQLSWATRSKMVFGGAVFQLIDSLSILFLAWGIGIDAPFILFLLVNPVIYLVMILPISLGGVGVREGIMVLFLSLVGVSNTEAAMVALLIYVNHVLVGLLGGGFQLVLGLHPREDAELAQSAENEEEDSESSQIAKTRAPQA